MDRQAVLPNGAPPTPSSSTSSQPPTPSPLERERSASQRSFQSSSSYHSLNEIPLAPLPQHLAPFLLPDSPLSALEKRELFTSTFLRSASSGNSDTLEWLLSVPNSSHHSAAAAARRFSASSLSSHSRSSSIVQLQDEADLLPDHAPRKWVNVEATDDEGNTALGLCVALGHAEGVRVLVEGGASVSGGDRAGWTPLHWAVQNNDVPIAAYLANHRASPSIASHKGLTPKDLIFRGRDGLPMREVLKCAEEATESRERMSLLDEDEESEGANGDSNGEGRDSISRRSSTTSMRRGWEDIPDKVEEEAMEKEMLKRMELAKQSAVNLEVDFSVLSLDGRGANALPDEDVDEEDPTPFDWNHCLPDQMLVFTYDDLPIIFDVVITNMKPVRARKYRVTPANVIFLCGRFAHYFGGADMIEELFLSAIERIEAAVHNRPDDMANCAFWLSNCLLLLYYLRKEPNLASSTSEYQVHLCDLVNEIFVFIIRDAERRIDRILEAAILEHEALPGFEDLQFEGDWASSRFVKKLTGRGKKSISKSVSARSLFADTVSAASSNSGSPAKVPIEDANPRTITSLLSSTLFILQLYEIPPSIIVQAFSQLFYWISCEVFNRLLTQVCKVKLRALHSSDSFPFSFQKKFICRSKALQIRMNASTLEDWARLNRMPSKMVPVHFAPLNQLLQWLQCLSSESSIDGLIGTIQSLRSLNPLQLRRAVRDYRYEVDEPRISEDCAQYLLQIQKQWERLRVQKTVEEVQGSSESVRSSSPTESNISVQSDVVRMIDKVFADPNSFGHYTPPGGSEALGELLNSRYMLPFAVPSSAEMLVNTSTKDAFGPFSSPIPPTGAQDGAVTPRSVTSSPSPPASSILESVSDRLRNDSATSPAISQSSSSEGQYLPIPILPDEFFAVLDAAKAESYGQYRQEVRRVDGLGLGGDSRPLPEAPGNAWGAKNWRDDMPGDEESSEDEEEVEETPRQRAGSRFSRPRPSI
ncbi:hypothetical protein P7C70_g95, partial [Phenoliferia sp. Uapishka_3]